MKPLWTRIARASIAAATFVAATLLLTGSAGCLARTAVGTNTLLSKFRGDTETVFLADARRVTDAAEDAVRDLDLDVLTVSNSGLDGVVTARTAAESAVQISVRGEHRGRSRVWVWVGPAGDEPLQERLLEAMRIRLGLPPIPPDADPALAAADTRD
jgi:hypothetical protein